MIPACRMAEKPKRNHHGDAEQREREKPVRFFPSSLPTPNKTLSNSTHRRPFLPTPSSWSPFRRSEPQPRLNCVRKLHLAPIGRTTIILQSAPRIRSINNFEEPLKRNPQFLLLSILGCRGKNALLCSTACCASTICLGNIIFINVNAPNFGTGEDGSGAGRRIR